MRLHTAALSPSISRHAVQWVSRETALESKDRDTSLRAACDQAILAGVSAFRGGQHGDPKRLIESRIFVAKTAAGRERGVIVVDYQYVFPLFAGLFDIQAIAERYEIVLEPSWAGVCTPEILLFSRLPYPVHVETIEPRDHEVLNGDAQQPSGSAHRRELVGRPAAGSAAGRHARHRRHHGGRLG